MSAVKKILIAGDADFCAGFAEQFSREADFSASVAATRDAAMAALAALAEAPDILLIAEELAPLASAARAAGFSGRLALLAGAGAEPPGVDIRLARPTRFHDLLERLRVRPSRAAGLEALRDRLTEKEAAILDRLERAVGAIVSRETLLREVWGYSPAVSTRTLETHVHRLRRKIESDPTRPSQLLTEAGGYRLCAAPPPDEG